MGQSPVRVPAERMGQEYQKCGAGLILGRQQNSFRDVEFLKDRRNATLATRMQHRRIVVLHVYALECLVVGEGEKRRIFITTTVPPTEHAWIHDRWTLLTPLKGT